jgi:Protein of unknown function (DUF1778)
MKDHGLQLRADAVAKRRLEEAASEAHFSVTAFVLQAANRAADDVPAERQTIRLSPTLRRPFPKRSTAPRGSMSVSEGAATAVKIQLARLRCSPTANSICPGPPPTKRILLWGNIIGQLATSLRRTKSTRQHCRGVGDRGRRPNCRLLRDFVDDHGRSVVEPQIFGKGGTTADSSVVDWPTGDRHSDGRTWPGD